MDIHSPAVVGTLKSVLLAHPISIAVVGGALMGTGSYFLAKKFFNKDSETATPAAAE